MAARDKILQSRTLSYNRIMLKTRDTIIPLQLKRHLAPRTVRRILASLPLQGNAHYTEHMAYINTEIKSGLERGRDSLSAGDVAFSAVTKMHMLYNQKPRHAKTHDPSGCDGWRHIRIEYA